MARMPKEASTVEPTDPTSGLKFGARVWKCIFDIMNAIASDQPPIMYPVHTIEGENTYMVRVSDDGRDILIVEDRGRVDRDHAERQLDLMEEHYATLTLGENPRLMSPGNRWYDRMVAEAEKRVEEREATMKQIMEIKERINSKSGIITYRIPIAPFKKAQFTVVIATQEVPSEV